jgi:hypothetical protein
VTFTWFDPPFRPEPPHSNQAYGICFTEAGMIVLGAHDGDGERYWNLLGGGVELLRWDPQHEINERRLVRPEDFLRPLSWGSAPSAAIILAAGLKAEAERRQG